MKKIAAFFVCILALLSMMLTPLAVYAADSTETITISGTITFDEWEKGMIRIAVYDVPDPRNAEELTYVDVDAPGPYSLKVKASIGQFLYLHAYNDCDNDGPPIESHDPRLYLEGAVEEPLFVVVESNEVTDVNLRPGESDKVL